MRMLTGGETPQSPLRQPAQSIPQPPDPDLPLPPHQEDLLSVTNAQHDSTCVVSSISAPTPDTTLGTHRHRGAPMKNLLRDSEKTPTLP